MMCWSWIDSSRKREALTISCPGPGIASLRRCKAGPGQKIAKTTPCKVEWTPARSTLAALRPGHEKKGPNLIPSRSTRFPIRVLLPASGNALWVSAVPGDVGYWRESGKHVLYLRFTAFDPNPTLNRARVLPTTKVTRGVPREIL